MTLQEIEIIKQIKENKELSIVPEQKYSDEFYETCLKAFVPKQKQSRIYLATKRAFDFLASLVALVLLAIPFLIISIAIKLDSKGPAFFKNRRVGKNGKIFNCLKFRSMSTSAPPEEATSVFSDSKNYITKVGHFLRKTSIDELPQLLNVFTGKMSFIGYRPLVPTEEKCNEMRNTLGVFRMEPGISGYSQIHGRDLMYYKNKALMDAYYVNNASIGFDVKLVFKTVKAVLSKEGNEDERE